MKLVVLALLGIVGLSAFQAQAHTHLSESIPADEAVVTVVPKEIVLGFSAAVRLTAVSIRDRRESLPARQSQRPRDLRPDRGGGLRGVPGRTL